jgi:outer membrane murein-binding lipoprotein Lpp
MVNRLFGFFQSHKWLSLIGIAIIVLIVVLSITGKGGIKDPAVPEEDESIREVVTLEMFDELGSRVVALNSTVMELTKKMEALKEQQQAVDAFLKGYAVEVSELKDMVEQIKVSMSDLNSRFEKTEMRLAELEQAAEAAKNPAPIPEPELQINEPFVVSSLMRWGEQELAVIKIPAGYQFLGTGQQYSGWQIAHMELVEGKVLLRHLESGREVMQSLRIEGKAAP